MRGGIVHWRALQAWSSFKDVIGSPKVGSESNLDYMLGPRPDYDELTGPGPNSNPFLYYINILSITICFYNCTIFIHILSISPGYTGIWVWTWPRPEANYQLGHQFELNENAVYLRVKYCQTLRPYKVRMI